MYVLLFFACSFLGWCMEVTCKLVQFGRFINRGFLLGPLCPIYGTGAVLMAYFLPLWTTQVESTFLLALVLCGTLTTLLVADVAISAGVLTKIRGAAESVRADNTEAITKAVREALMAQGFLLRHPLHAFPEVQFYNKAHFARLKAKHDELQANMREKREKLQQELDRLEEKRKALKKGKK